MKGLDAVARDVVGLFEGMNAPYAIMGGLAVRVYALPRPTYDVDFTVSLARQALPALYREAEQLGFSIPAAQVGGWVDAVHGMPVIKLQWFIGPRAVDVDLFLAETPFQAEVLRRRRKHSAEGWDGWFVTAEDLILLKLLANRPKDRVDVADILFIQGDLDVTYMRRWAERMGVANELEAALTHDDGQP
jgi:hypothetical protein